jgi:hypothetical protein
VDWEAIAAMITSVVLFVVVGAVVLLRPLAKRLGDLAEAFVLDRREGVPRLREELERTHELLQSQRERVALLEERLDFTEELVREASRAKRLGSGDEGRE